MTSLKASINNVECQIFEATGYVLSTAIDKVTEKELAACIELRCKKGRWGESVLDQQSSCKGCHEDTCA